MTSGRQETEGSTTRFVGDGRRGSRRRRRATVLPLVVALVTTALLAACTSSGSDDEAGPADPPAGDESGGEATVEPLAPEEVRAPTAEGGGVTAPQPAAPLPEGYVEEELFVGGQARSYEADATPSDGTWTATPGEEAPYLTRVLVRRPADAADFSGTVLVEWFNVSALEASPDWGYLSEEIGRRGHAYVGVSAQAQGVEGGETLLDVEADPDAAADAEASIDASGLRNVDPERYGDLTHPGDAHAFDIFTQVGRAVTAAPDALLGGFEAEQVIAVGESQSAGFLSTLINAVHPVDPVYDGFLVHSRGANVAPLDGEFASNRRERDPEEAVRDAVLIRDDVDVPVLLFEAETDLTLLGYSYARQPDTDTIRTWEVAGTAHADAHTLRSLMGGPRDPGIGSVLGCDAPINAGPHHEVLQAAVNHLVGWVGGGPPPPEGPRLELEEGDEVAIARDDDQIALGGVRTPLVDVPVAAYTGDPPGGETLGDLVDGEGGICVLFGTTIPFDREALVDRYGTADAYLEQFAASAEEAVDAGFLLREDADDLIAEAEADRALFG